MQSAHRVFLVVMWAWPLVALPQETAIVRPEEIDDVLVNPGIGFMTFQRFNGDRLNEGTKWTEGYPIEYQEFDGNLKNEDYPMTSLAYFRVYWKFIEPARDEYRWDLIDKTLKTAAARGQTLLLRIAPYGTGADNDVPDWYRTLVGPEENLPERKWRTDPEDPRYAEHFGGMVRDLGARYDGHPDLESVDLSIVGAWGEGAGSARLSQKAREALVNSYLDGFSKTHLVMLLTDEKTNRLGLSKRHLGWRVDCLGDMGGFSRTWCHMLDYYQSRLREKFLDAIGGLPERTPLKPQVTGAIRRDGYRVEKVIFQSRPKHFVTALLFVPDGDRFEPPYPGVLVPCGHARSAKGSDAYQTVGALLAIHGMAALVFDPIDQGERSQYLGEGGWPQLWGTRAHSLLGIGSTLLGRNTARFEIFDGMRAIDYLQSRPEIDPKRIGCTGNSGGGTQMSYLMALDGRIKAAAPSCYLCGFPALLSTIGPQDAEQNIFGQLAFGMDHADYVMMRAPRPVLICAATEDFFDIGGAWETFRYCKRLYTRLGFAERVDLLENDAKHNYNVTQREGVVRWMSRWLLGTDEPIVEPTITLLTEEEYQCTPEGQVMLLPGARSTYELNEEYEKQLAPRRAEAWKTGDRNRLLAEVRQLAGIRRLEDLPRPEVEKLESVQRPGYRIAKYVLTPEMGIALPALRFVPEELKSSTAVLYLHEDGKAADASPGGPIERLVKQGSIVLAVDLRGMGQTRFGGQGRLYGLSLGPFLCRPPRRGHLDLSTLLERASPVQPDAGGATHCRRARRHPRTPRRSRGAGPIRIGKARPQSCVLVGRDPQPACPSAGRTDRSRSPEDVRSARPGRHARRPADRRAADRRQAVGVLVH